MRMHVEQWAEVSRTGEAIHPTPPTFGSAWENIFFIVMTEVCVLMASSG